MRARVHDCVARKRLATPLVLGLVLCVSGLTWVFDPSTASVLQAARALGPISGWRCAHSATYAYDPRRDPADRSLLADAPEQFLHDQLPDLQVDWVEADLRGGDTLVWARTGAREDSSADASRRVYVLSPGRLQSIGVRTQSGWTSVCTSGMGDWHVVGEHALE